ncbi:hypothetical protein EV122DRAFT_283174 [Schizophyllum commune]
MSTFEIDLDLNTETISAQGLLRAAERGYIRIAMNDLVDGDEVPRSLLLWDRTAVNKGRPSSSALPPVQSAATAVAIHDMPANHPTRTPTYVSPIASQQESSLLNMGDIDALDEESGELSTETSDFPFHLLMRLATGESNKAVAYLNYANAGLDTGAHSVRTLARNFKVIHLPPPGSNEPESLSTPTASFKIDKWQWTKNKIDSEKTPLHRCDYADGSFYFYTPVSAKITIGTYEQPTVSNEMHAIEVPSVHYQLATRVSPELADRSGVDGMVGFAPQKFERRAFDSLTAKNASKESSNMSLMNQMMGLGRVIYRNFAISPAHRRPRLWLGVAGWPAGLVPQGAIEAHPTLATYAFRLNEEVRLRVFPRPGKDAGRVKKWVVRLKRIEFYNAESGLVVVVYEGSLLTHMDTGCELVYLPDAIIQQMMRVSGQFGFTIAKRGARKYTFAPVIPPSMRLRLAFEGFDHSNPQSIEVAVLDEALKHRNAVDADGTPLMAIYPTQELEDKHGQRRTEPEAYIGLNWLQYLWQLYRDDNVEPEICLVPGMYVPPPKQN